MATWACAACGGENPEGTGFCGHCGARVPTSWACAACGGENPPSTKFCGHCGASAAAGAGPAAMTPAPPAPQAPPAAAAAGADVADTLRSFVADQVADRLFEAGGKIPEERRLITALFADVSGFTSLADRLDPEELLEVIDPVISGLSSIVGRYEGYVEKFAGDALLALFGAPVSHEDDAARALRVALEMHAELARLCAELPHEAALTLHVGVNSGHGIARILGSEARMDYAVLGDAVILAQRLESAAPPGETYVSELTYNLTEDRFEFEPVGELTLKGKSEPVPAWRLLGARSEPRSRGREGGTARAFVGRDRELAGVTTVLDGIAERGAVVAVTGEPGVGKSRLSNAAREHARQAGLRWLETRCLSYGKGLAYWPYAELVRAYAGIGSDDAPESARARLADALHAAGAAAATPFLARLLGLPGGDDESALLEPEAFRRALHKAFASWLAALAREQPLVVAVEDVHWLDASSLELTRELARTCAERALVLYLTARPEGQFVLDTVAGETPRHTIELAPLDGAARKELVATLLGGAVDDRVVELVDARSAGNPLFVEELVRALRTQGSLVQTNGAWTVRPGLAIEEVPPTIEELLASRIDLLPRADATLLQTASVIGRRIPVPLLERVAGTDVRDGLERLLAANFLDAGDDGGLAFHHALVQDVAYSRLLRRQRRDLHRRVAEVAEALYGAGDEVVDLLARHLYLGEAGGKAVEYLVRAGERARRLFANEEAIVHLTRAVELAAAEPALAPGLAELRLDLADLHELVGNYAGALALYEEVRAATRDVRAWRGAAAIHRSRGEYQEALALVEEGFRCEALRDADLAPLWVEQGWTLVASGNLERAVEVLEAGLAVSGERRDSTVANLLLRLARAETLEGRLDEAVEHATAAESIFGEGDDYRGLATTARLLGDAYRHQGRLDDAAEVLRRGFALAQRLGSAEEIGGCLINLGIVEEQRGRLDDAIECYRRAIGEFERIAHGSGHAIGYLNLASVLGRKRDYDEAERCAERALAIARSIGHALAAAETLDTMATIALEKGAPLEAATRAEEAAGEFIDAGAPTSAAKALELAARAWADAGDDARARSSSGRARSLSAAQS